MILQPSTPNQLHSPRLTNIFQNFTHILRIISLKVKLRKTKCKNLKPNIGQHNFGFWLCVNVVSWSCGMTVVNRDTSEKNFSRKPQEEITNMHLIFLCRHDVTTFIICLSNFLLSGERYNRWNFSLIIHSRGKKSTKMFWKSGFGPFWLDVFQLLNYWDIVKGTNKCLRNSPCLQLQL